MVFSSIGYEKKHFTIQNNSFDTIKLQKANYQLPEIVVRPNTKSRIAFEDNLKKATTSYNRKQGEGFQMLRFININCESCSVASVHFFVKDFSKDDAKLRLRIFSMDSKTRLPGDELLNQSIISKPLKKDSWMKIPLGNNIVVVPQNGIFVGVEFLSDDEALSIGLGNKEKTIQTYMKYIGDAWYQADYMKNAKGVCNNLMVKVEINE